MFDEYDEEEFDTPYNEVFSPVENGELSGRDPDDAFAEGVEWATFIYWLEEGEHFEMVVSNEGLDRCIKLAERWGRLVEQRRIDENCVELSVLIHLN